MASSSRWAAALLAVAVFVASSPVSGQTPTLVRRPANYPACTAAALTAACDPTATGATCAPAPSTTADLIVDGGGAGGPAAVVLGGTVRYRSVTVRNCGRVYVRPYNGNRTTSGILTLVAPRITIDATSSVVGDGAGYQPNLCRDGDGPMLPTIPAIPAGSMYTTGGLGGCRVADSAGGGGHFGPGGRGTKDCSGSCVFPRDYEQACTGALPPYSTPTVQGATACPATGACRDSVGGLSDAGPSYFHSIYTLEMGAAGGDAGCRDGDGFDHYAGTQGRGVGGAGGAGIALVSLAADQSGSLTVQGYIAARGARGCAWDNDSGGGGAGGSVLLVGDTVTVADTAVVSAEGGPGGSGVSTGGGNSWWNACGASNSSLCDDCGGGGGGGIINVQSRTANLSTRAFFLANGGPGGGNFDGCTVCQGGAGGGAGEVQLDGAYVGELCDGFDNDFDGTVDNGFGTTTCGLGTCARSISACTSGAPPVCTPTTGTDATCLASRGTARPRVAIIQDTSGSMLLNLAGSSTFGDGSADHPGIDLDNNGQADDSRLFLAKSALTQLISAYPEIDFALARYHQDTGLNRSCQTAKWFECQANCCTYDNPRNGSATAPVACNLTFAGAPGVPTPLVVRDDSALTNHCINYAGTCGPPRRGADLLVGFESDVRSYLRWLDGAETRFDATTTPGNFCGGLANDCELRGTGPTPLAGSLQAIYDYMVPIRTTDPAASCRDYSVILVSDGGEDCGGDPAAAAAALLTAGVRTYVIGLSVNAAEGATLNSIAVAGGSTAYIPVNSPAQLLPALVSLVSASIRTEVCNGRDDNCNGVIDEGFNVGAACDDGRIGACRSTGHLVCDPANNLRTTCMIDMPGRTPAAETCNGADDNCDGRVDEGDPGGGGACGSTTGACRQGVQHCQGGTLVCVGGTLPGPELCDGLDNDCNGMVDDGLPSGGPCGSSLGSCTPGRYVCRGAMGYVCEGAMGGTAETCNGVDDDCDGVIDNNVPGTGTPCTTAADGSALCMPGVTRCIAGNLRCQGGVPFHAPVCTCTPDSCALPASDGGAAPLCPGGGACIECACRTPCRAGEFPCSFGLECRAGFCVPPLCGGRLCADTEVCQNNVCVDRCATITCAANQVCRSGVCLENSCYYLGCPAGQLCRANACVPDRCLGVRCAADQFCRDGACVSTCENIQCPQGQSCRAGACVADPCVGVTCPAGQVCGSATPTTGIDGGAPRSDASVAGSCVRDPCMGISCGTGRACANGVCADDPCANIRCPGDPSLVVCRGGECVNRVPLGPLPAPTRVVTTGGSAFGCAAPPGSAGGGGTWALLGLAWVLARRVTRRAGAR